MTRSVQPLYAADKEQFRFYCCGPTVYGPAHIGNFRTFLTQDVLRRALETAGLNPKHVRNLTDVDDKTIRTSIAEGKSLDDFTQFWTKQFHKDCSLLNMVSPHVEPKATEHIPQQVELIEKLIANDLAYKAEDGSVYFKVSCHHDYGKLTRLQERDIETQNTNSAGEVNDADEYDRESANDFALWKSRKPEDGDNYWPSPWGEGRPGWHLECSAMSIKYLGETFDLHGGGMDLCFPHHENEIAQSEGATGKPFARHWFHGAMLQVEGTKMSKSLGNLYTLEQLEEKGYTPMEVRYVLISGHYRQPLNFTFASLNSARSAMAKMEKVITRLLDKAGIQKDKYIGETEKNLSVENWASFQKAWDGLADDLNVSKAIGGIFTTLAQLDKKELSKEETLTELKALNAVLNVLGIKLFQKVEEPKVEIPEEIQQLAQQRWDAKQAKDWSTADELRNKLTESGWTILDKKDGFEIQKSK